MSYNKHFHVINVGNSIITNYQKMSEDGRVDGLSHRDEKAWQLLLSDKGFMKSIAEFLRKNPKESSAELNAFERYLEKKNINPSLCEVYLVGTDTASNSVARKALEDYFRSRKVVFLSPKEVEGGFSGKEFDTDGAQIGLAGGVVDMIDSLVSVMEKKKNEGYEVAVNPTGGMKPHVITCALVGFMTACEVYYIHEEFENLMVLPPLFYLPRGREVEVLKKLGSKEPVSGAEFEKLNKVYEVELGRLEHYNLVDITRDDRSGRPYRVRITNKGALIHRKLTEAR